MKLLIERHNSKLTQQTKAGENLQQGNADLIKKQEKLVKDKERMEMEIEWFKEELFKVNE